MRKFYPSVTCTNVSPLWDALYSVVTTARSSVETTDWGIKLAVLERVAERLLRSCFVDFGTGTLGSSRYLLHFLMWYPSFIKMRVKHDLLSHSKLWLAWVISHLCQEHNPSGFWVFVSSTTFGHKSCICSTVDSCRVFLYRVSSHHYLYHRQNMDPRYSSFKGKDPVRAVRAMFCAFFETAN